MNTDLGQVLGQWMKQGAAPAENGQVENVQPNNQVIGAIHTVLADPTNPDILYAGSTNGGIWRTKNATKAQPSWTPLTDSFVGNSIGAMAFDSMDSSSQTLVAAIGRFSSYAQSGGPLTGLRLTENGGKSFTQIDDPLLKGRNFSGVAKYGDVILATANSFGGGIGGGVYRSADNGQAWEFISGINGLANGNAFDLVSDPNDSERYYVSIQGDGIFLTEDSGQSWTNISDADMSLNGSITDRGNNNTEMAVADNGRIYAAVLVTGQPSYIGFTDNPTAANPTWTEMDLPITQERNGDFEGLSPRVKPGGQGGIHFAIVPDPNDSNIVYVGGDRQDVPFPNAIGANDFTGRLFRGDTTIKPTDPGNTEAINSLQWQPLTHGAGGFSGGGTISNSAPHADAREITFDANGDLIEVDDGGIYRRTNPATANGDWFSIIGDLQVTEQHDIAYDTISNIIISGNQDTGTTQQQSTGSLVWDSVSTADGGDVAVSVNPTNPKQSVRYSSFQNLGSFGRRVYDQDNNLISNTTIALNGFNDADRQFNTPVIVNSVNANRLVIGGGSRVYESFDQGDNVIVVNSTNGRIVGVNSFDGDPIAYGARDNEDILYIGSGNDVFARVAPGGDLVETGYSGDTVRDIVLDLGNSTTAFAVDDDQVFQTTNTGNDWIDITGDLSSILDFSAIGGNFIRSIEYINRDSLDAVVIGTTQGVFSSISSDFSDWFRLGAGLPNVPVWDLDYDPTDDFLVAGTLGRGSWSFSEVSAMLPSNIIEGTSNNDFLIGTAQNDLVNAGNAQDELRGLAGKDILNGGDGDDLLLGGTGDDVLNGGSGQDILRGEADNDLLEGAGGDDRIFGDSGDDELYGGQGQDLLLGGTDHDLLHGGTGDDVLRGGSGNDTLFGNQNNDQLIGGRGNDWLNGGQGDDRLTGGEGNDIFVISKNQGKDTITDFNLGQGDQIGLSHGLKFVNLSFQGNEIRFQNKTLATVSGVNTGSLNQSNFVLV